VVLTECRTYENPGGGVTPALKSSILLFTFSVLLSSVVCSEKDFWQFLDFIVTEGFSDNYS